MKKIKLLLLAILSVAASSFVASCSNSEEAGKVADKITRGEVLTQSDFSILIDYCGDFAQKAQTIQDKIDNLPDNDPALKALDSDLTALKSEYPHTGLFFKTLKASTPEEVGSENVKKVDGYSSLIWFDAPEWAETLSPSGDAGLIETTTPADSNIIAAPELELHETRK